MTLLEAIMIKIMRNDNYTWRRIAEIYAELHEDSNNTQERGRELCVEASKLLNEEID